MSGPCFQFAEPFGDARVEELKLLSWAAQHGEFSFESVPPGPWHDLMLSLVASELLTVYSYAWAKRAYSEGPNDLASSSGIPGESVLERSTIIAKVRAMFDLHEMRCPAGLRLTHRGRVRYSELKQSLRSGREREPFGILWDVRHWEQDLQIAILEAREGSPLALAYLDMNGLKQINDTHGHDAGDLALRTYFQAVASVLGDGGQAYRLSGGADEVVVVLPNRGEQAAVQIVRLACTKLMSERLWPTDTNALLSIAAGVITTTDPTASPSKLRSSADEEQKRAKVQSKLSTPRPSVVAVNGKEELIIIKHEPGGFPAKISGSYFMNARKETGITLTVTNTGKDPLPPFKVGLFHPKLGSYFIFPSEKPGPLLPDQVSKHHCVVIEDGKVPAWFPKLTHGNNGEALDAGDDADFEFRLVLEDSDDKVLYANRRVGRGLAAIMRRAVQDGPEFGGTWHDWNELNNTLPDK